MTPFGLLTFAVLFGADFARASGPDLPDAFLAAHGTEEIDKCKQVIEKAPPSLKLKLEPVCQGQVRFLKSKHFDLGTYIITEPGIYTLTEDIVFAPNTGKMSPRTSDGFRLGGGFFLGFFAALAVAADNVFIDLNGYSISSSLEFTMRQRFFSVIELANLPFLPRTGPPQFARLMDPITSAHNVVIHGGSLGLSSHMGIHGNDNRNVFVHEVSISNFETGGIQLNGGSNVHLSHVSIGPSLGAPGSLHQVPALATLSQAINILHCVDEARMDGAPWVDHETFTALDRAVETFILRRVANKPPMPVTIFNDPAMGYDGLPDGSALYGVLMSAPGPAVGAFDACSGETDPGFFSQSNVSIKGLHLNTHEIAFMKDGNGRPIGGPAGDLFQIEHVLDDDGKYTGNVLSDAQLLLGQLALAHSDLADEDFAKYFDWFGSTNIPEPVQNWANGSLTARGMLADLSGSIGCGRDSMNHVNKGIVAERIECIGHVSAFGVTIKDLLQKGTRTSICQPGASSYVSAASEIYLGADVTAIRVAGLLQVDEFEAQVDNVTTVNGRAVGLNAEVRKGVSGANLRHLYIDGLESMKADDVQYFDVRKSKDQRLQMHEVATDDNANDTAMGLFSACR